MPQDLLRHLVAACGVILLAAAVCVADTPSPPPAAFEELAGRVVEVAAFLETGSFSSDSAAPPATEASSVSSPLLALLAPDGTSLHLFLAAAEDGAADPAVPAPYLGKLIELSGRVYRRGALRGVVPTEIAERETTSEYLSSDMELFLEQFANEERPAPHAIASEVMPKPEPRTVKGPLLDAACYLRQGASRTPCKATAPAIPAVREAESGDIILLFSSNTLDAASLLDEHAGEAFTVTGPLMERANMKGIMAVEAVAAREREPEPARLGRQH